MWCFYWACTYLRGHWPKKVCVGISWKEKITKHLFGTLSLTSSHHGRRSSSEMRSYSDYYISAVTSITITNTPLLGLLAVGLALGPQMAQSEFREARLLPLLMLLLLLMLLMLLLLLLGGIRFQRQEQGQGEEYGLENFYWCCCPISWTWFFTSPSPLETPMENLH